MIVSASVSDLVFALTCVGAAVWLLRQRPSVVSHAAVGMLLMAVAASFGCLRYAGVSALVPAHRFASALAGGVAPGCFALVALAHARGWSRRVVELGLIALTLGWLLCDRVLALRMYETAIGSLAIVIMLVIGALARSRAGVQLIGGALILALAGLVIGSEGTIGPLLAIDVFHVTLAVAHLLIAAGLVGLARSR